MSWITSVGRLLLISALSLLLGWFYGYPFFALLLVLLCLIGFWVYQMQRVQDWLQDPEEPPPDAYEQHRYGKRVMVAGYRDG